MLNKYPTKNEYQAILDSIPYKIIKFDPYASSHNEDFEDFYEGEKIKEHVLQLQYRIFDIMKSYVMLKYYFDLGIPDDDWQPNLSEGKEKWLPYFNSEHHQIKAEFDYYVDIFYYKYFSFIDIYGKILMIRNSINDKNPTFFGVIEKIGKSNNSNTIYQCIMETINTVKEDCEFAHQIRNNITHEYSPNKLRSTSSKTDGKYEFHKMEYVSSKRILNNINVLIEILPKLLKCSSSQ